MHLKKPIPLTSLDEKPRRLCAVCGMVSYSQEGMHPQCAQVQADAARVARIKTAKKTKPPAVKVASRFALKPWHKSCPKCHTQIHVRKQTCDCGYRFS